MQIAANSRKAGIGGIGILVGCFMLFCGLLMLIVALWRGYREHDIDSRWVETPVYVKTCALDVYRPSARHGVGAAFSLRCRLSYEFQTRPYQFNLHTTSNRIAGVRNEIEEWVATHGPGSKLDVLVNPANPNEIAVLDVLPVQQFNTAREAWITALIFLTGAAVFILVGRAMRAVPARQIESRPQNHERT
jgi:hypothetical protein